MMRPTLPSSNRTCGFPASGSRLDSRRRFIRQLRGAQGYCKPQRLK